MCTEKECSRKFLVKGKMQGSYYSDRLCLHIDMPWQQELHDFPVLQVCCEASLSFCTLSRSHSHSGTCLIRLAALLQRSLFREISSEQQVNGRNRTVKNQKDRRNTQELFNNIVNRKEIQNTRKAEWFAIVSLVFSRAPVIQQCWNFVPGSEFGLHTENQRIISKISIILEIRRERTPADVFLARSLVRLCARVCLFVRHFSLARIPPFRFSGLWSWLNTNQQTAADPDPLKCTL